MNSRLLIFSIRSCIAFFVLLMLAAHAAGPNYERRICTWAAVGPFTPTSGDGLDQDFLSGEADAAPKLGDSIDGKAWLYFDDRLYCRNHDDYNDFFTFYMPGRVGGPGGGTENKVAYAAAYVWSPQAQQAHIAFGANEKARVWLNGKVKIEITTPTQAMRDSTTQTVQLQVGWNRVLIKVVNIYEIWGFYFYLTDPNGKKLEGMEFSPEKPQEGRPLKILTPGMPTAYTSQPYEHLEVRNPEPKYPVDNPSASPYRLCGVGGTPPYSWNIAGLPSGLNVDPAEGEILGKTAEGEEGHHTLTVTMSDSSSPPQSVQKQLTLEVKPRVTKTWWETGTRMGGLRHGGALFFDRAQEQAALAARQGVSWIAPTGLDLFEFKNGHAVLSRGEATEFYKKTMQKHGIRICNYIGIPDGFVKPNILGVSALHERLKLHMEQDKPGLFWLDGSGNLCRQLIGLQTWEFDALFSMIKTMDPECLVLANAGGGDHKDWELGDMDLLSLEGNNNHGPVNYWSRWPTDESAKWWKNEKFLPIDSWRFPEPNATDWMIWTKTFITLWGETENIRRPRMVNFDQSPATSTLAMHKAIGDWITPRKDGVIGVFPEAAMTVGNLGYCVYDIDHPKVRYVQLIANERKKTGWTSGDVKVEHVGFPVASVKLYPELKELSFKQAGELLTIDMTGVKPDQVATLLQVSPAHK